MFEKNYVTLNISSTGVRLLWAGGREVKEWGSMALPPGLVKDGLILRPKVVGAIVNSLFKSTGAPREHVIASLTGLSFIHRILNLPKMERNSLAEALQRAARKEMLLPLEELYFCKQALGNGSQGNDEVSFFVLGIPRKPIDVLVQALAEADIQPYLIDLNPLALARLANREEAVIVNMEPDCFDIVLIAGGLPAIMHTITPGGEGATLEDNIRLLADELLKTIDFYNSNHPQDPLKPGRPVLLTGEMSARPTTGELLSSETGYPVEPLASPFHLPADLPAPSFSVNLGLALKKLPLQPTAGDEMLPYRDINLNVLSGKFRTPAPRLELPHLLLSLMVVAGLGLLFPVNHFRSQAGAETARLQTDLTGVTLSLKQAQLSLNRQKLIEDNIAQIASGTESARKYQRFLSEQRDHAQNLMSVTGAFPLKAYFTRIEIGDNLITVDGKADNPFTVVGYVTALESLGRFPEVRIASIEESKTPVGTSDNSSPGVSFSIVISQ